MNQPTALNTTSEWENVVNFAARENARYRREQRQVKQKLNKQLDKVLLYAVGAVMAVIMACAGWITPWVAGIAAVVLAGNACFTAGKFAGSCEAHYGR